MSIFIEKTGILTTIQDLGRNGFRKFGINPNGAMDQTAVRLINILLGNSENEAVLEMHFPAPRIRFEKPAIFALGGADFSSRLNNRPIENWRIQAAEKNDILIFPDKLKGNRSYLSVRGGFKIEKSLNSKSTNLIAKFGGLKGKPLTKGDKISLNPNPKPQIPNPKSGLARSIIPPYSNFPTVRFIPGAEYKDLTALSEQKFLSENFKITNDSNRMGFRLKGPPLFLLSDKELVSSAVNFGTIQLPPDGQPIVLMADHQTTGGYPRIGHIIEKDLPLVAQLGPGTALGFYTVSIEEAENLKIQFEKDLNFLKMGLKFKLQD